MDSSKSVIWVLLLAALTLFDTCSAFVKALERSKLDGHDSHDIEFFVEQRVHFIHAKIDLRPTITGLITLNKCAVQLDRVSTDSLGTSLANNLLKRMDRIVKKLKRVHSKLPLSEREKRSIEFIGNIISEVFGNPGPTDWKQAKANFLALHSALKTLNENSLDDHTNIDTNTHIIEKHNNELRQLSAIVNRNLNEVVQLNQSLSSLKRYFDISTLADVLENQVDILVEIKIDSVKGFCSDRALSKEFLVNNLQTLEANKAGLGPVFGSWEWRDYFRHDMCTIAMVDDSLWVTMRIPLVMKAEKLVRVIPTPRISEVLTKLNGYGLQVNLFREKNNDKYHVMTQSSLDLCNNYGSIKTCGVRDARFGVSEEIVIPVEFSINKFLLVGQNCTQVNLMEKCPNGIVEHKVATDVVMMVPNNCSYVSSTVSIDKRESDVEIMKEIGILQFDKFVITPVESAHINITKTSIETIASRSSSKVFELNMRKIDEQLRTIDTRHESFSSTYSFEKWVLVGVLASIALVLLLSKLGCLVKKRRGLDRIPSNQPNDNIKIVIEQPTNDSNKKSMTHVTETSDKPNTNMIEEELYAEHEYQEMPNTDPKVMNFSSRPSRSQFAKK